MSCRGAERARARGAKIYAEVAYGLSSDAKHVTEPDPTGEKSGACDEERVRGCRDRSGRDRLRRRARDVDTARRRGGDAGDQARARRGERAQDADLLDERRNGHCLVRRVRSRRSSPRSRSGTGSCRRRSTRRSRIQSATSTTSPTSHATPTCACGVELVRLRRPQRLNRLQAPRGLSSAGWRVIAGRRSTATAP